MKNKLMVVFLVLIVVFLASGCEKNKSPQPTQFTCFQQGVAIVDTVTVDGAVIDWVHLGNGWDEKAWVWEDQAGTHSLLFSGSITCLQTPK